jgi:YHS domain-containing protein
MKQTRGRKQKAKMPRMMKKVAVIGVTVLLLAGVVALFLTRPASTEATAGQDGMRLADRTRVCMLQDTVQAQAGLAYEHQGKTYYLCCGGCLAAFKAGAAQYSTAVDPVTRATVDKATAPIYAYRGHAYFFASEEALARFAQEPQRHVTASAH